MSNIFSDPFIGDSGSSLGDILPIDFKELLFTLASKYIGVRNKCKELSNTVSQESLFKELQGAHRAHAEASHDFLTKASVSRREKNLEQSEQSPSSKAKLLVALYTQDLKKIEYSDLSTKYIAEMKKLCEQDSGFSLLKSYLKQILSSEILCAISQGLCLRFGVNGDSFSSTENVGKLLELLVQNKSVMISDILGTNEDIDFNSDQSLEWFYNTYVQEYLTKVSRMSNNCQQFPAQKNNHTKQQLKPNVFF